MENQHQFQPGDRVVCVDADHEALLIEGEEYTIAGYDPAGFVTIEGIQSRWNRSLAGFYPYRFQRVAAKAPIIDNEWWRD